MKQNKEIRITIRVTQEQYDSIRARAETAQLSVSAYVRAAAMRHKIVVIDGLKEFVRELKGIGRNLNRLTILANEERFTAPDLTDIKTTLERIYERLSELVAQERR